MRDVLLFPTRKLDTNAASVAEELSNGKQMTEITRFRVAIRVEKALNASLRRFLHPDMAPASAVHMEGRGQVRVSVPGSRSSSPRTVLKLVSGVLILASER